MHRDSRIEGIILRLDKCFDIESGMQRAKGKEECSLGPRTRPGPGHQRCTDRSVSLPD